MTSVLGGRRWLLTESLKPLISKSLSMIADYKYIYILTCSAVVWRRLVRWAFNSAVLTFVAFIILTTTSISVSREIDRHKNRWQNGEYSDCDHERYFQLWKWESTRCIVLVGHYIRISCGSTCCRRHTCRLIYRLKALMISHYFGVSSHRISVHRFSVVNVRSVSSEWYKYISLWFVIHLCMPLLLKEHFFIWPYTVQKYTHCDQLTSVKIKKDIKVATCMPANCFPCVIIILQYPQYPSSSSLGSISYELSTSL